MNDIRGFHDNEHLDWGLLSYDVTSCRRLNTAPTNNLTNSLTPWGRLSTAKREARISHC
jgi:hypothetical protein